MNNTQPKQTIIDKIIIGDDQIECDTYKQHEQDGRQC